MREGYVKMMQELREGENRQSFETPGDWSNKHASKASAFAESSAIQTSYGTAQTDLSAGVNLQQSERG